MFVLLNGSIVDLGFVGQVLGLLLSAVGFFIYFAKTRRGILSAKLLCDVGYSIQQAMIGAPTGAMINCVAIFRELVFYYRGCKKWASHKFWLFFFIGMMGLSPILTWMGAVSLLPAIGSAIAVVAFYCNRPHHTRIIGLISMIPWLVYCIIIPNYGVLLTTVVQMIAASIGLVRDYREMKKQKVVNVKKQ